MLSSGKGGSSAATEFNPATGNPLFTAHPANVWCAVREAQYSCPTTVRIDVPSKRSVAASRNGVTAHVLVKAAC